jgi:HTH-type transcriptional regulator, global nitrogen regulator NrpRI
MPNETDRKMMEILRILADREEVLGAKTIAEELKRKGYNLGERAVRYHMRILDEKGFTERIGYAGRKITDKGLKELDKGLIYDQVDFIFSKFESMIYQTTLDPAKGQGTVVVNTSSIVPKKEAMDIIKEVFQSGLSVSPLVQMNEVQNVETGQNEMIMKTICGTTIDGMLLNEGIPTIPQYGGIVKVEDHTPIRFTELIAYKKTSMTPLEAFTAKNMTSVLEVVREGNGMIPANFRIIPNSSREKAAEMFKKLEKVGISGLLKIGNSGESVLGVPVEDDMTGIAVIGGIAPLCAVQEAGFPVNIKLAENLMDINELKSLTKVKPVLKPSGPEPLEKVQFLLSKAWNLIQKVDFDPESQEGHLIANISYVNKEDLDEALEIMEEVFKIKPEYCTSRFFKVVPHPEDKNRKGIATICSLSIDGILIKNGIMSTPKYGGILELEEKGPRFVELTAYSGSSIDPHEIYISKGMTSVYDALDGYGRILASLKEIPYLARPYAMEIMSKLEDIGLSISKVGDPSELIYNAKVERYRVGIVTPGGLNPLAAVKEQRIEVETKAVETMVSLADMDEF